ncbi:MAG: hypothetical protein ACLPKT_06055, partial [Methylocella sp.]
MKFSRANLLEIVMLAERDFSYENIAARLDCARKSIYNWLSESRARADAGEGAESPYYVVDAGVLGELLLRVQRHRRQLTRIGLAGGGHQIVKMIATFDDVVRTLRT